MIRVSEIRRHADALGVHPAVVDHGYVLGCFLHYLSLLPKLRQSLIFKGGTCLRKCYFAGYRFSEDLDFTASSRLSASAIRRMIDEAKGFMQAYTNIRADELETVVEIIADDYGKESFEAKLYYQGPWKYGGTPHSMRVHVNRDERLLFPPQELPLIHIYSDQKDLPATAVRVYALEGIMAEKLRAFSGQHKWAVARDIYDIFMLSKSRVDIEAVRKAFPKKCAAKGIVVAEIEVAKVAERRAEYEKNWRTNLEYLIPANMKPSFEEAWNTSLQLLSQTLESSFQ